MKKLPTLTVIVLISMIQETKPRAMIPLGMEIFLQWVVVIKTKTNHIHKWNLNSISKRSLK